MRSAILATAAAFAGTAVADVHMRRHGHEALHHRGLHQSSSAIPEESCGCTTEVITYWGEPTTIPIEVPTSTVTSETTSTVESTSYTTITVTATSETPEVTLPTPGVTSFTETGTYTIPATTITVTDTTTVCGATTTDLPSGTHTYGGVTTIVETATTITCPIATVKPTGSTVTSVIETTTYVCPTPGTYTINPTTTFVPTSTVVVYPTPATITPGTYTNPESTITVTRTDFTYVCPYTNGNEPTAVPTNTAVPTTTTEPSSTTTSVPIATGGPQMGMTFTPYETNGACMSKDRVLEQVGIIKQKGFSHVRVYGTDCHTLEYVGAAAKAHGLKLILGVYVDKNTGLKAARPQFDEIANWGQWGLVDLIAVGNELINQQVTDAATLAGFVSDAKSTFQAAGYTGKVTTAETMDNWLANKATLCPVVDILGANLHPFFNPSFTASQAGELVSNQIRDLKHVCPGLDVINLETGWPNGGIPNGLAIPGKSEQATAIKSLVEKVGADSVFFSYADDAWKNKFADTDTYKVETHWGCIDVF